MRINGELKTDRDEPLGVNNFGPFQPGVELEFENDVVYLNPFP